MEGWAVGHSNRETHSDSLTSVPWLREMAVSGDLGEGWRAGEVDTQSKDSSFQKSASRAREGVAEGGGEDLELQGHPESRHPGLLKGKRQKGTGNQSCWVDHRVASWGAGPPHGINRPVSVPCRPGCGLGWNHWRLLQK